MPAALLLVACSRNLGGEDQTGSAGSSGTAQGGGGTGGVAGTSLAGSGGGGMGGVAGTIFVGGGTGGIPILAACPARTPTFSVCVVNNTDQLPLPDVWQDSVTGGAATVEAVGMGTAPAQCQNARVFGAATNSDRWFQARTTDDVVWTIGLGGLGDAPTIRAGDLVRLDLDYRRTAPFDPVSGFLPRVDGYVQLSDGAGTPLLWAGSNSYGKTWLSFAAGQPVYSCMYGGCPITGYDLVATVNGSVATVPPFGAQVLGGYYVAVSEYDVPLPSVHTQCNFSRPPPFAAAAVKAP